MSKGSRRIWVAAAFISSILSDVGTVHAADGTWTGAGGGNWSDANDWSDGVVPGAAIGIANTDAAVFNLAGGQTTITADSGRNIKNIIFDLNAPALTINGGPLLLSNGGAITVASTLAGAGVAETFNTPLTLEPPGATIGGIYSIANHSMTAANVMNFAGGISGGNTTSTMTLAFSGENAGISTISGPVSNGSAAGGLALLKNSAGILVLSAANTYTGGTTVNVGTLRLAPGYSHTNSANNIAVGDAGSFDLNGLNLTVNSLSDAPGPNNNGGVIANSSGSGSTLTITGSSATFYNGNLFSGTIANGPSSSIALVYSSNGTLILAGANTGGATITKGTLQIGNGGTTGSIGSVNLTGGTLAFDLAGNQTHAGIITSTGGTITQVGLGTLNLTGANTYAAPTVIQNGVLAVDGASGSIANSVSYRVSGGTLKLDNTVANSNRIKDTGPIILGDAAYGGGMLWMTGGTTPTTESNAGAGLTVSVGANTIQVDANNTLTLGNITITRVAGGTLNLITSGGGTINTFSQNDAQGIINGWSTVNSADWAVNPVASGSNPVSAYTGYTPFASSLATTSNVLLTGSGIIVATNGSINTLKIDTNGNGQHLELGGGKLTFTDKAMLFVGANDYEIQDATGGGSLGANNRELIIHNYGLGTLTISAAIASAVVAGNGALTITGTGTTVLSGASNFTGAVNINGGIVQLGAAHGLSSGPLGGGPANIVNINRATLDLNGYAPGLASQTLNLNNGSLANSGSAVICLGAVVANGMTANLGGSGDITLAAALGGGSLLTKTGNDSLILTSANSRSGGYQINTGILRSQANVSGAQANPLGSGAITLNGGTLSLANAGDSTYANPLIVAGSSTLTSDLLSSGIGTNYTFGTLAFNTAAALTVNAGSNVASGTAQITIGAMNLNTNVATFDIGADAQFTATGAINGFGSGLTKTGNGIMRLDSSNNTYTGDTIVDNGTLTIGPAGSIASGNVIVASGATLNVGGFLTGAPNVTAAGTIQVEANGGSGILARSWNALMITAGGKVNLSDAINHSDRTVLIAGALSNAGTLDLSGNDLIVRKGNLSDITNQLANGFNHGSGYWNGQGIVSGIAANDSSFLTALGVIQRAADGLFDGQFVAANDVLVKYTWYGDADLSGKVDGTDYSLIDHGFNNSATGWQNGDFNYDGKIDGSDYSLIDNAFNLQGSNGLASPMNLVASHTVEFAQPSDTAAIPEPADILILGMVGLMSQRGRRRAAISPLI